jgi:hypothetical protein
MFFLSVSFRWKSPPPVQICTGGGDISRGNCHNKRTERNKFLDISGGDGEPGDGSTKSESCESCHERVARGVCDVNNRIKLKITMARRAHDPRKGECWQGARRLGRSSSCASRCSP